jgi:hypothetical protein
VKRVAATELLTVASMVDVTADETVEQSVHLMDWQLVVRKV